ncbi:MAG: hypothetical protein QXK49_02100 [Candidatus Aenigmatarchaeota archaeon]
MREKDKTILYSFLLFIISLIIFIILPHLITLIALGFFSYGLFYEIIIYLIYPEKAFDSLKPKTEEEKNKRQKIFWIFMIFLFLIWLITPFIKDVNSHWFGYLVVLFGFMFFFLVGGLTRIYNNFRK